MIFLDIALTDLRMLWRDRKAMAVMIVMPVILITILGFALNGIFSESTGTIIKKIKVAVVLNKDAVDLPLLPPSEVLQIRQEALALNLEGRFTDDFLQNDRIRRFIDYRIMNEKQAIDLLNKKEINAAIVLPANFSMQYVLGNQLTIRVVSRELGDIKQSVLKALLQEFADRLAIPLIDIAVARETMIAEGLTPPDTRILGAQAASLVQALPQIHFRQADVEKRTAITSSQYYAAAMAVMFVLFAIGYGMMNIVMERQNGTLNRLRLTGINLSQLVMGKALSVFITVLMQLIILMVFSRACLGVDWGSDFLGLAVLTLATGLMVAGIGVLLASVVRKRLAGELFQSAVVQLLALLGGCFLPIYVMPRVMQDIAVCTPNGMALRGYLRLMEGGSLDDIAGKCAVLALAGLICLLGAIQVMRREELQ
ncbi:MAG: ABC transporter permease [Acidobacteriota bacterium]